MDEYIWREKMYNVPVSVQEHHAYDEVKWTMNWADPESWLPTYAELVHFSAGKRGWDALDKGARENITSRWDTIKGRFFARYCDRRINRETATLWQVKLQEQYDALADRYERAYKIYADNGPAALLDVHDGMETEDEIDNDGETRSIDTPDSAINQDPKYADRVSKNKHKRKGKQSTKSKGNLLPKMNENIQSFKDIDTQFISEFESLFLNILG